MIMILDKAIKDATSAKTQREKERKQVKRGIPEYRPGRDRAL